MLAQCAWMFSRACVTNSDRCSVSCTTEIYKSMAFPLNVYVYVWNDLMSLSRPCCIPQLDTHTAEMEQRNTIIKQNTRTTEKGGRIVGFWETISYHGDQIPHWWTFWANHLVNFDRFATNNELISNAYLFTWMWALMNLQIFGTWKAFRAFGAVMRLLPILPRIQYFVLDSGVNVILIHFVFVYLPPWCASEHEQAFYIEHWSHDRIWCIFPNGNSINQLTTQWHGL